MKLSFSYVVLRYMHDVFTREFVNVAVVVYCPKAGFLKMRGLKRFRRALAFFPGMDRGSVWKTIRFLESRFDSHLAAGQKSLAFETLDAAGIAKSILPSDDSSFQWSVVGGGATENPERVLEELFQRLVTRHEDKHPAVRRTDEEVWRPFEDALEVRDRQILSRLQEKELFAGSFRHRFEHALQPEAGPLHLLLPLSFDLVDPSDIVDKAVAWNGRVRLLRRATQPFRAFLLLGKPSLESHQAAYFEAKSVLESEAGSEHRILPEDQASAFADEFSQSVLTAN